MSLGWQGIIVCQWAVLRVKCPPYHGHAIIRRLIATGFADSYFDFLECLEYSSVVLSTKECRPHLLRYDRMKLFLGKEVAPSIRVEVGGIL